MNLANTLKLRNLKASAAGAQATVPDSRSSDEWIKNWLDQKNKRLNDLRQSLHKLLDYPEAVEIESAYRMDKRSAFPQDPGRVAGHGRWAVVSPEDEIISRWDTKEEADAAAWPAYKGIKPSATGASGGARVKELSAEEEDACDECDTDECEEECDEEEIDAADIFQDEELGDKTRAAFLKHEKPEIVKNADILRKGDRRPSSRGQGSAGTGGAGAGGAGGGVGI